MKTDTRSWVPDVPVIVAELDGHEVEPEGTTQTTPTPELETVTVTVVT
jgi:hypothetical protein